MDGYEQVTTCMGTRLWEFLERLPAGKRREIWEIRLRPDQPVALTTAEGIRFLLPEGRLSAFDTPRAVRASSEEIAEAFRRACGYSVHSWEEEAAQGFLTLEGGHRVGIAGTASAEQGRVRALREVGSLNFRIARNIPGAAGSLPEQLYRSGPPPSVLVAGEPGSGKTTFLRDLARRLSSGEAGRYFRVAVVDERSELSGSRDGRSALNLGPCTDLADIPKERECPSPFGPCRRICWSATKSAEKRKPQPWRTAWTLVWHCSAPLMRGVPNS